MAPENSLWHVHWLAVFLGWKGWKSIARISYALNMMHVRIIVEISFGWFKPSSPKDAHLGYVMALYSISMGAAFVIASGATALETTVRDVLKAASNCHMTVPTSLCALLSLQNKTMTPKVESR